MSQARNFPALTATLVIACTVANKSAIARRAPRSLPWPSRNISHGYQLMKTMEQRLAGGYTPSAGVIYPTLTMLEEEGLAECNAENGKKVYSLTKEGKQYLKANKRQVEQLFGRIDKAGRTFERGRSPEIMQAFHKLRSALVARVSRESVTAEQIAQITGIIRKAANEIEEF